MSTVTTIATDTARTRALLLCYPIAGAVFGVLSLAQALTRDGFDFAKHPVSILSNGDLGWLQIATFVVTGVLAIAGAIGLGRAMRGTPGGTWAPRLAAVHGVGTILSGVFVLDPGQGFPVGHDETPTSMSLPSMAHLGFASIAFAALIAACFVVAHHFSRRGDKGLAFAARAAGTIFLIGDVWPMVGGYLGPLALCVGVLTAMALMGATALIKRSEIG